MLLEIIHCFLLLTNTISLFLAIVIRYTLCSAHTPHTHTHTHLFLYFIIINICLVSKRNLMWIGFYGRDELKSYKPTPGSVSLIWTINSKMIPWITVFLIHHIRSNVFDAYRKVIFFFDFVIVINQTKVVSHKKFYETSSISYKDVTLIIIIILDGHEYVPEHQN